MLGLAGITGLSGQEFSAKLLDDFRKPIYIIPDLGEENKAIELQVGLGWRGMTLQVPWPEDSKDLNDVQTKHGLDTVSSLLKISKRKYDYEYY